MRSLLIAVSLAVCATLSAQVIAPAPATAAVADSKGKTRKEFQAFWQERFNGYVARHQTLTVEHKQSVEALADPPFMFEPGDKRLEAFTLATLADAEVSGRGMLLEEFLKHMEAKPSLGLTRAWLQSQFDVVRNTDAEAERLAGEARAVIDRPGARVPDLVAAMELSFLKRGEALGRAKELVLLADNFAAYAGEFAQADARDQDRRRRFAAALSSIGAALQQNRGWIAQCHAAGPTLSCSGN